MGRHRSGPTWHGRDGTSKSYVAGFAEVEVDVETGIYKVLDFVAVADVWTVIHPRNLGGQILGDEIFRRAPVTSDKILMALKRPVKAALRAIGAEPSIGAPLEREPKGLWRFRVRRFRIVYAIDRSRRTVRVMAVAHRRHIYDDLTQIVRGT